MPPVDAAIPTVVAVRFCTVSAVIITLSSALIVELTLAATSFQNTFVPRATPIDVLEDAASVPVKSVMVELSSAVTDSACVFDVTLVSVLISAPCCTNALLSPLMILAESAPEIALLDVETDAEITPFRISCLAVTPTEILSEAVIVILLSTDALSPTTAFLSVKNKFNASEPPTEFAPPEPATAMAKLRISVRLVAFTSILPPVVLISVFWRTRASTSVSMTLKPKAPARARSFDDTPPAALMVSAS